MLGAVERKRRDESTWNDLWLDKFEAPKLLNILVAIITGARRMYSASVTDPSTSESSTTSRWESSSSSAQWL